MNDIQEKLLEGLVDALEDLIDDMAFRRDPPGTWGGHENRKIVRDHLKKSLTAFMEVFLHVS